MVNPVLWLNVISVLINAGNILKGESLGLPFVILSSGWIGWYAGRYFAND